MSTTPLRRPVQFLLFLCLCLLLQDVRLEAAQKSCQDFSRGERAFPCQHGVIRKGIIYQPDGTPDVVTYELINGVGVFQGDILFQVDKRGNIVQPRPSDKSTGRSNTGYRWPGARIPYVIDPSLPNPSRVTNAIVHWEANTPMRFVSRTTEADYLRFVPATGCSSSVGRQGGAQNVNLADGCSTGNAIHEIGHAAGLWHEQSRTDRDSYVIVNWANIQTSPVDQRYNFQTYAAQGQDGFNYGPYDYGSIMHYGSYDFNKNGLPTITKTDGSIIVNNREYLSSGDISGVNYMYPPPSPTIAFWCTDLTRQCHFDSFVSAGTSPFSYEWYFSDAPYVAYGDWVDHTFSSYGDQVVELKVTDSAGRIGYGVVYFSLDPNATCMFCEH
jgi:hypothetical protein